MSVAGVPGVSFCRGFVQGPCQQHMHELRRDCSGIYSRAVSRKHWGTYSFVTLTSEAVVLQGTCGTHVHCICFANAAHEQLRRNQLAVIAATVCSNMERGAACIGQQACLFASQPAILRCQAAGEAALLSRLLTAHETIAAASFGRHALLLRDIQLCLSHHELLST